MALKDAYLFIERLKKGLHPSAEMYLRDQCLLSELDDEELLKVMNHYFGPGCELLSNSD